MKPLAFLVVCFAVLAVMDVPVKDVEIETAPMSWKQAALTDGNELYGELCAVCHGINGKGDGPAAPALKKGVPDLTMLASNNLGTFPREAVEKAITGKSRIVSHGTVDMPIWGRAFENAMPGEKLYIREGLARQRIYNLTAHLESMQVE
jgi:mono/diheme cytochrome c family protein